MTGNIRSELHSVIADPLDFVQGLLNVPEGPVEGLRAVASMAGVEASTARFLDPERVEWSKRDVLRLRLFRFAVTMGVDTAVAARAFRLEWTDLDADAYLVVIQDIARDARNAVERTVAEALTLRTVVSILDVPHDVADARAA